MVEGAIYKAVDKVLLTKDTYSMKEVASTEFASGKYFGKNFATYTVGAALAADFNDFTHPALAAIGATKHYVSFEALMDAIAINMYEEIYDRDFTNEDVQVDSWAAIKKELLSKVLFIDRTAGSTRNFVYGVNSKGEYAGWTIGDAESIVAAYVMYDYANNAARVYFDSYASVTLTDEVPYDITVDIAGADDVTVTAVYASNVLKNETVVTIDFGDKYLEGITVVADGAENLLVGPTGVFYTVADATYDAVPTITATAVLTKVAADKITAVDIQGYTAATTLDYAQGLVDGVHHAENVYSSGDIALAFGGFDANAYDANLKQVGGNGKEGALYFSYVAFELDEATAVKKFRVCVNDYSDANWGALAFAPDGVVVLVSNDAENWTKVGEAYDLVDGDGYFTVKDAIRDYYASDVTLSNTDAVKYVAFAIPGAELRFTNRPTNPTNGLASAASGQYSHYLEIEFYK
jgi:hypothetical protein